VLQGIRCGWLEVPENRAEPEGRRLRLAVAVVRATAGSPRAPGRAGREVQQMAADHHPRFSTLPELVEPLLTIR
jgi:hypothetical protein